MAFFRYLKLIALLLCVSTLAWAGAPADMAQALYRLRKDAGLTGTTVGVSIRDVATGKAWYSLREDSAMTPASTMKLMTAMIALEQLGPEYRFSTQVLTDGQVVDGVLQGNLLLRGGGDPTLLPGDLGALAGRLAIGDPHTNTRPIRVVRGKLLLDDSFFPRAGPQLGVGWEAADLPWYYAAPISALAISRNAVTVSATGTVHGQPADVTLDPATKLVTVVNETVTSANVQAGALDVIPRGSTVIVRGRVAPAVTLTDRIALRNPPAVVEEQFRTMLEAAGIVITGEQMAPGQGHTPLAEHLSLPLSDIIVPMLKESDNHTAEQLRWAVLSLRGAQLPLGERYKWVMRSHLDRFGIPSAGVQVADGSGLSRQNALAPATLTGILRFMAASPHAEMYYQALPIAGVDGTLKKRMIGSLAEGNARAKTGTLRGVSGLAGYVNTRGGERLTFAILVNGYRNGAPQVKAYQDALVAYLAGVE